jgi:hypothetical protein
VVRAVFGRAPAFAGEPRAGESLAAGVRRPVSVAARWVVQRQLPGAGPRRAREGTSRPVEEPPAAAEAPQAPPFPEGPPSAALLAADARPSPVVSERPDQGPGQSEEAAEWSASATWHQGVRPKGPVNRARRRHLHRPETETAGRVQRADPAAATLAPVVLMEPVAFPAGSFAEHRRPAAPRARLPIPAEANQWAETRQGREVAAVHSEQRVRRRANLMRVRTAAGNPRGRAAPERTHHWLVELVRPVPAAPKQRLGRVALVKPEPVGTCQAGARAPVTAGRRGMVALTVELVRRAEAEHRASKVRSVAARHQGVAPSPAVEIRVAADRHRGLGARRAEARHPVVGAYQVAGARPAAARIPAAGTHPVAVGSRGGAARLAVAARPGAAPRSAAGACPVAVELVAAGLLAVPEQHREPVGHPAAAAHRASAAVEFRGRPAWWEPRPTSVRSGRQGAGRRL